MTFNIIENGDILDATEAMENWRHTNFGSPLLPVDNEGNPVNDTIDIGSSTYNFKRSYIKNASFIGATTGFGKVNLAIKDGDSQTSLMSLVNTRDAGASFSDQVEPYTVMLSTARVRGNGYDATAPLVAGTEIISDAIEISSPTGNGTDSSKRATLKLSCGSPLEYGTISYKNYKVGPSSNWKTHLTFSDTYTDGEFRCKRNPYFLAVFSQPNVPSQPVTFTYNKESGENIVVSGKVRVFKGFMEINATFAAGTFTKRIQYYNHNDGTTIDVASISSGTSISTVFDCPFEGYLYLSTTAPSPNSILLVKGIV